MCNAPTVKSHSSLVNEETSYLFNKSITIQCENGYETNDKTVFICGTDGTWGDTMPACTGEDYINNIKKTHQVNHLSKCEICKYYSITPLSLSILTY